MQFSLKRVKTCAVMAFALLCGVGPMYAADSNTLDITTQLGAVKGTLQQNDVGVFYDIPYGKNPFIKERRFQAPQAYGPWQGLLDATKLGQPVPQPSRGQDVELVGAPGNLTLNIWAPKEALHSDKKLPVMVWIPGGAFIREDAGEQVYNGSSFAKNDVIVVTVNYRVGVDGFMHLEGAPDNRGILDQILALEWVNDYIADFGGDPDQVTLFGQSAGAESVAILLGIKKARGLFQKAIMQSPPMQSFTQEQATRITKNFAEKLSVPPTVDGIASVPFTKLVATVIDQGQAITDHDEWGMISWGGTAFLPIVDNTLITGSPMQMLANHSDPSIPVIVGSTDQEARLYLVPNGAIDTISQDTVSLFMDDLSLNGDAAEVYASPSIGDTYVKLQSDFTFRMPALHIAEHLVKNGHQVWHYNFSWYSPAFGGRLGPAHFVDVPFTFNTIDTKEAKGMVGDTPPESLAQAMHKRWIQFATSTPTDWKPYNLDARPTMRFDSQSQQVNDPEARIRELWKKYSF